MAKKKVFSIGSALSQGLEDTIESAQNNSGELRIDVVPLRKIELDPANPRDLALTMADVLNGLSSADRDYMRKADELESLQSIANSIKSQGLINPITVYKHGEKIVAAYTEAKAVPQGKITIEELSHLIGCVKSHAMNYKTILNADHDLKQLILENKIKNLEKAALIADIKQPETRRQAIDACMAGATLKQLKSISTQRPVQIVKPVERRGRQSTAVNFGGTRNINVARFIIESLVNNSALAHVGTSVKNIDWNNHRAVTESFRQLLKSLEKMHA